MNLHIAHRANPIYQAYLKDKALRTDTYREYPYWEAYVAFQLALFADLVSV